MNEMGTNTFYGYGRGSSTNYIGQVVGSNLNQQTKTELLLKLTGKRKTVTEGCVSMMKHQLLAEPFDEVLRTLKYRVANPTNLGAVETALRNLIDKIKSINLSKEEKSLFLFTSQALQFSLGDLQFEDKENNFVPTDLQDYYQMVLKGASLGIPTDKLDKLVYTDKYQDKSNPAMADFVFLDNQKVREINGILNDKTNLSKTSINEKIFGETVWQDMPKETVYKNVELIDKKIINIDTFFKQASHQEVDYYIGKLFAKCDKEDLRNVFSHDWESGQVDIKWKQSMDNVFNFVKDSLTEGNSKEVSYANIHKSVKLFLRYGLEVGHKLQQASMKQQVNQKGEERFI